MLKYYSAPDNGGTSPSWHPEVLMNVLDYLHNSGGYLNFILADFETVYEQDRDANCLEMVAQVRNYNDSAINNAYIGNYDDYPAATDYSNHWGTYDRSERNEFYANSGMNVAMPALYPYTAYRNHAVRDDIFGANLCVSIPHALFWTPLEKYSTAKVNLPSGHLLIPWVGGLVLNSGYEAPIPTKVECRTLLQHIRLRGVDGYYTWSNGTNTNYSDAVEYRDDMYASAWHPLDWFFALPGKSEILNLATNKTGGIEWSGMRRGNHCIFIFSNYTTNAVTVNLPSAIENLPETSPSISAADSEGHGGNVLMDYVIGPKSYWKLEGNANDNMAAGNNGTITGAATVSGKVGNALSFNGASDGVSFGDVLDMGTADRSISLWFKTTQTGTNKCILSKGYSCTGNQHAIYLYNGKIYCLMDISGTDRIINSGVTVNDGNWHHVAVTIQRNGKMKLYLDGTFKTEVDISADAGVDAQNTYGFYLGRSNTGQYFNGLIDEVKIFTGVLSEQEVFDEYADCVFSGRLDEYQGTMAHDDTLDPHNGTISGSIWSDGKTGNALTFDGTDDQVSFGDVLDMGTGNRSISLWFKTAQTGTNKCLLSKGYSCTGNQHAIYLYNGNLLCLIDVSGTDRIVNSGLAVNDGNWHHAVVTIDRNASMKLYLDGALKATTDISMEAAVNAQNSYSFYLGRSNIAGQYFQGSIDDVKIYEKALNATEVNNLYDSY